MKKGCVVVGLGSRSRMYLESLSGMYSDWAQITGLCDRNWGRVELARSELSKVGTEASGYPEDQFDRMLAECRPSLVIVTCIDRYHDEYIVRALRGGCDVITEKPMTIDATRCQRILDAVRETGRSLRVTFNYRYSPVRSQVKELLLDGVIGEVISVDFHWLLNTSHGADYFRRWHRNKENSGGLLVHKASHHFDLVNWWLGSVPEIVAAFGARRFYTPQQAGRYGLSKRAERCLDCREASNCRFHLDLRAYPLMRSLYLEQEDYDGYYRDRCVFDSSIDIEDSINVVVQYASGTMMSYSLNAFAPWEGYWIVFNGTKGRLEHNSQENEYINGDGSVQGAQNLKGTSILVQPHGGSGNYIPVQTGEGGHGGGDEIMLQDLFDPHALPDPLMRAADHRAGAYSILAGVAANQSIAEGRIVRITDLIGGMSLPDYPGR